MKTTILASQPIGHYEFCRRYPQMCRERQNLAPPLPLTDKIWRMAVRVNAAVNKKIQAATDAEIYGREEYWEYPDKYGSPYRGDCEDYALMKQRELQKRGIAAANLLITVVRKRNDEAHAVLTLRTDSGDYILDNLSDTVLNWQHTDYNYIKRQDTRHAGQWVAIAPRQNTPQPADTLMAKITAKNNNFGKDRLGLASTQSLAPKHNARQ